MSGGSFKALGCFLILEKRHLFPPFSFPPLSKGNQVNIPEPDLEET
jgi:hypothetical protein